MMILVPLNPMSHFVEALSELATVAPVAKLNKVYLLVTPMAGHWQDCIHPMADLQTLIL